MLLARWTLLVLSLGGISPQIYAQQSCRELFRIEDSLGRFSENSTSTTPGRLDSHALTLFSSGGLLQLGPHYFRAQIDNQRFENWSAPNTTGKQQQSQWCWAACIQMVLNYHGVPISQAEVVQTVYGSLVDQTAGSAEVLSTLNNWFRKVDGSPVRVWAEPIDPAFDLSWIELLGRKLPVIVGLRGSSTGVPGHAYVIKAVDFSLNIHGQIKIHQVTLADPFPGQPTEKVIRWEAFQLRRMNAYLIH